LVSISRYIKGCFCVQPVLARKLYIPANLVGVTSQQTDLNTNMLYCLTVGPDTELVVSPMKYTTIKGEVNVLRYLSRLGPPAFNYELNSDPATSARLDGLLDTCYTLARCKTVKEQQLAINDLSGYLGKGRFMAGGNGISIADVAVWSVLRQIDVRPQRNMSSDMKRWLQHCSQLLGCGKFYILMFRIYLFTFRRS